MVTAEFNRVAANETEAIRDFIILHYHLTQRTDAPLWQDMAQMKIPDSLQFKIDHFRRYGRLIARDMDIFGPTSWLAVHVGQLNLPQMRDPLLAHRQVDGAVWLNKLSAAMAAEAARLPTHQQYIDRFCRAT